ncbi:MAG: rRNA pseudouridine synthase [Holosporaceae bacterium]|jgi:23S rRNA pseudouridine2605 synthase|nr:rRNA pseudouridine synthase [Holosporaceae bacterium]
MRISSENKIRLAKRIAESGIASRRESERLIESGRVSVDGNIVNTPVFFVDDSHEIRVDGELIQPRSDKIIIWKFYKPRGVITTKKDPQNRKTVFDFFPEKNERIIHVGRLDYNSEGLLLFTNNGNVARKMELPSTGLKRTYRARILGKLTDDSLKKLKNGITIDGIKYGPVEIVTNPNVNAQAANRWITLTLSEGKNREVRRLMEHCGCTVNRLIRVAYGPFRLDPLLPGQIIRVPEKETKKILKFYAL